MTFGAAVEWLIKKNEPRTDDRDADDPDFEGFREIEAAERVRSLLERRPAGS